MKLLSSSNTIALLWDGTSGPQSYPNVFHTTSDEPLPGTITFDMGRVYDGLTMIEETGRDCCHNPVDFEVWGIADTTGAFPDVSGRDPLWTTQTTAKGWTLLTHAIRGDDGQAPMKFNFMSDPPPVRFIRIRFLKSAGDPNPINASELTFWYRL